MKTTDNLFFERRGDVLEPVTIESGQAVFDVLAGVKKEFVFILFNNELSVKVNLMGKDASCDINGIYLMAGTDKGQIKFDMVHVSPDTVSHQNIRGVLTDSARMVFDGVIRMPRDSQRCAGYQNHRAVLLSEKAVVRATPELEIYADDVQCAHGSAVGPLETAELFYLMARGIPEKEAKQMLLKAFLSTLLPEQLESVVDEWMAEHV